MKLKIGITCYPSVGGSGVIGTELGKLLAERGHEIHFITSSVPFRLNKFYPNIFFHEVQVNQYSVFQYPPYDLALASKIAEVAEREQLDLIHVHYAMPHAVCGYLAKQMTGGRLKVVTTLHGTDITILGYDASLKNLIRFSIEQSDVVTAVSQALVEQTYELIQPTKEIATVYNFIDERVYRKRDMTHLRKEYHIGEEEKVITHVSNFRKVKRVQDVIQAFARIQERMPAKLLLVGDGPEHYEMTRLVRRMGLQDRVLFVGKQENVEDLLSMSDLLLLLSEKESFGLVLLEAMSCGVPCIGTNVGGVPEVIEDGQNGYICELGDIETVAERAVGLLQNEALYEAMCTNALRIAQERFGSARIVSQYETMYRNLLGMTDDGAL